MLKLHFRPSPVSENKLRQEQPNSKISFFPDEIVALRDVDWKAVSRCYISPDDIEAIDHVPIVFKDGKTNGSAPKKRCRYLAQCEKKRAAVYARRKKP